MPSLVSRRRFIGTALAAVPALSVPATESPCAFSFPLLGDLHLDKLEHHDFTWLEKDKAGDIKQIQNYSRITTDIMPRLFTRVRETVKELNATAAKVPFVVQVGDLVEGLCGSLERSTAQNRDALQFVRVAKLGVPFLFAKGNHDVTGPGSVEAFKNEFHPFLTEQTGGFTNGARVKAGYYSFEHGWAQFCFFDAYDSESLGWLEATLAKRSARHCFVVIHPPVVPYGARATWNLYASAKQQAQREKLLELLGNNHAFVLGGHIHKYNVLVRETPKGGRFLQLAVSSIINAPEVKAKDELKGVEQYNGDQVRVEPGFSKDTEAERRAVYETERPFIKSFEYADLPGYAVVSVDGPSVKATIYSGISRDAWRTLDLTKLLLG